MCSAVNQNFRFWRIEMCLDKEGVKEVLKRAPGDTEEKKKVFEVMVNRLNNYSSDF